jgi:type IV secretory pathway TrbD component
MTQMRRSNRVHRSLSRPLTILGAERKLFFFAMCLGAATFNLLASLLGGLLMFLLLYVLARWATATDPQILRFLLNAARLRPQYDPMKFSPIEIRRDGHVQAYRQSDIDAWLQKRLVSVTSGEKP